MVLYVLRYFPTLTETFVYREIAELTRRGVEIQIVAIGTRADGVLQDELPPVPVLRPPRGLSTWRAVRAAARALGRPVGRREWRWLRVRFSAKVAVRVLWLAQEAERLGVTRIHAHFAGEAAEWARSVAVLLDLPFGVTVHATDLFRPRPSLPRIVREANPLVAIAEHHRALIADRYGVQATVVRCGVEPARYAALRTPRPSAGPLRVVCVARYAAKKGVDALVHAVERLPVNATLRLVSDAPRHLASNRTTVGPLPPSEIPAVLWEADVFALPCRVAADGDRDGIPVALMEAMAAGLPVITSAISGIGELVDDEVGWLVPPNDDEALSAALLEAAASDSGRARRGQAGRARVSARGFTIAAQVDGLQAAWDST